MKPLVIEVVEGHHSPEVREFGGDKPRTVYEQTAYIYTGGAYPERIKNTFSSLADCLQIGAYTLCPSSYRANQYGSLELDRFNMKFIPHKS